MSDKMIDVLIIDNNSEDRAYIKEILFKYSGKEYQVNEAKTIDEGRTILKNNACHIILLDLFLSGTADVDGLKLILKEYPSIPVIAFTAIGNEELGTEATILGARDYLVKGAINNTGLIKAINNTIHRYSLKMTCEDLSLYLQSSLNPLRQIMGYGYNANIPPDFSMLFRSVKTKIKELRFSTLFSLFFMNKKDNQLVLVAYNYPEWGDRYEPFVVSEKGSSLFKAVRTKKVINEQGSLQSVFGRTMESAKKEERVLCIPLVVDEEILGVITLHNYAGLSVSAQFLIRITMLLSSLKNLMAVDFTNKKLEELLLSDELTGLYNARYLLWELDREIKRAKRYRGSLSVLFIDIDGLKAINDAYGYMMGDYVLRKISAKLKGSVRNTDLIGRYGGDEFIVILTETKIEGAHILRKRIQKSIMQYNINIEDETPLTVHVTISAMEYDLKIETAREVVDHVQRLLVQEKNKENERVVEIKEVEEIEEKEEREEEHVPPKKDVVHIYFIEPLQLISVVIDTLVRIGFESYQVDEKDKVNLLKILNKNVRNVIFICISSHNELPGWFEYINKVEKLSDYVIQIGVFIYSKFDPQDAVKFLEKNIAVIKFSDIQKDTLSVLKKILFYFEAKGKRGYVRVEAIEDSFAFFTIESERSTIKAKILNISEQAFACHVKKSDVHHIVENRYFPKVLLRLKGIMVPISVKALTSKKDNSQLWVMHICSAIYVNNKVSYSAELNKETKDKIHRYIRLCLKENIKKKLQKVQQ